MSDSIIQKRFKVFCETYLTLGPKTEIDREHLYQIFKYAYLIGRKDFLDEELESFKKIKNNEKS